MPDTVKANNDESQSEKKPTINKFGVSERIYIVGSIFRSENEIEIVAKIAMVISSQ